MKKRIKIGFDVGGVLSKYPHTFKPLLKALHHSKDVEVWIISDMHPEIKITKMLDLNGVVYSPKRVRSADYSKHGEMCKSALCEEIGIDIMIDDYPGYVAHGEHVRLFVWPHPHEPYYHDDWKTDGSEGLFGRRTKAPVKRKKRKPCPSKARPTKGDHQWP